MNTRLALLCLIGLAGVARAGAEEDAAAIADRYLAFMRGRGYAFLTEEELARRRDEVAAFVAKHLRSPFDEAARAALLDGVDHCLDRLYKSPAGTVEYGNGFGSGGEEWMYLQDRDCFRTFLYQLWVGLTRQALTPEAAERRDAQ
ncbi:MAG TPA: hypothetical protein VFY93_18335, partial [Planctomycetota bacterium]|nr:hypothetical protein [Planctomycetota bacterium]